MTKEGKEPAYHAFLSYARTDDDNGDITKFYQALQGELRKIWRRDCGVFMDVGDIHSGDNWREVISQGLTDSNCFIAMVSLNFIQSGECRAELEAFRDRAHRD